MNIALTIFGTPNGTDAIISPSNFELPDELYRVVDAKFHFYDGGEVFRIKKLKHGTSVLRYYSIHTRANDQRSTRDGAFIGAGVFCHSDKILDATALVECLRKMLRNAMDATVVNGQFIKTITESASQIGIPEEFDSLLTPQARPAWPLGANTENSLCFIPLKGGALETPEALIALNETMPGVLPNSLYFSADSRCEADCQKDSDFQVVSVSKLLSMSAEYQGAAVSNSHASVEMARREADQSLAAQAQKLQQLQLDKQTAEAAYATSERQNVQNQALIQKLKLELGRVKSGSRSNPSVDTITKLAGLPFWVWVLMIGGGLALLLGLGFCAYQIVFSIFATAGQQSTNGIG